MIVITGAAGFIGSVLAGRLNALGYTNLVLVDDFTSRPDKARNWEGKVCDTKIGREEVFAYIAHRPAEIEAVFHIGAKTDTTLFDKGVFDTLNVRYSQRLWQLCAQEQIPFIYASSAATYGAGEHGYADDEGLITALQPLNPYGQSKQDFDVWALAQTEAPYYWRGFKFFNVYGPNEYHKGRMASVIFHAFNQIRMEGRLRLFRSHNPSYTDGGQMRDFIYVFDLVEVLIHSFEQRTTSGIFNLGTGKARTFLALGTQVFRSLGLEPQIEFIDTPADIRDKYQYFTEANMDKLRLAGYDKAFTTLEDGIDQYVQAYLLPGKVA